MIHFLDAPTPFVSHEPTMTLGVTIRAPDVGVQRIDHPHMDRDSDDANQVGAGRRVESFRMRGPNRPGNPKDFDLGTARCSALKCKNH